VVTQYMAELTPKQRAFVLEYLKDRNATQAAIRAGYSEASAHSQAHDLLKNPKVAEFLAQQEQQMVTDLREMFAKEAATAWRIICDIAKGKAPNGARVSARTMLDAAKDMLDRAGYKPTDKIQADVTQDGQIHVVFNIPRPKKEETE
jgi:hypothetical protein